MGVCGERLKELREQKGLYPSEVAKILGISRTAYIKYESEETAHPRKLDELAAFFGVSADYLLGRSDSRSMLEEARKQIPSSAYKYLNEVPPPTDNIKIPIIGSVKCGYDGLAYEYLDGYVMIDNTKLHGDIKAFRCYGDSMNGIGIFDGDIAIVRVQDDVESGELAIVIIDGEEGTLKRIRKQEGAIILESANPAYPPRVFTGENMNVVKIVGKVMEIRRKI
jgi:repressor LexA